VDYLYGQTSDLRTLKELIKAVFYMNRLMTSFQDVILPSKKQEKTATLHMKIFKGDLEDPEDDEYYQNKMPLYEHYPN
jgi:hypothetical protein